MPSSTNVNGNATPLPQPNTVSVNDTDEARESSTGPIRDEAAMQNASGPASN
jgi:hypothetical protein